jgi:hypothetical protein
MNDNEQNLTNGQEQENKKDAVENNIWNGIDLNTLTVDKLKEELKTRKIDFPKNARKKELQELLINSNK